MPEVFMRKVEAGVYETHDGRYRVERVDSLGEWDSTSSVWTVTGPRPGHPDAEWPELAEAPTKRDAVLRLRQIIAAEDTVAP